MTKGNKPPRLLIILGPYTGDTVEEIDANIVHARRCAIEATNKGWWTFSFHLNTAQFERLTKADNEHFMGFSLHILETIPRATIYLMTGWRDSPGVKRELDIVRSRKLPVYFEGYKYGLPQYSESGRKPYCLLGHTLPTPGG